MRKKSLLAKILSSIEITYNAGNITKKQMGKFS